MADATGQRPPPELPTDAPPGSRAKVLVLMERARKGQRLWHPGDATSWDAADEAWPPGPRLRIYDPASECA